jgi:hypothetical protein
MEGFRLGPSRKLGDGVYLSQEAADDFTRIISLAQSVNLRHRAGQGVFRLRDGDLGVVLALLFETVMMLEKLLAEEFREAVTGRTAQRPGSHDGIDAG